MERHTTWRRITSYTVTGRTIQRIADFIQNRLPLILNPDQAGLGALLYDHTTLFLYGSGSSILYKPIHTFTRSLFSNDIRSISLELTLKEESAAEDTRAIVLLLRFGAERAESELSIALQAPGAREKVLRIEDALLRTLEPERNRNYLAYPNEFIPTLVFVAGFVIGLCGLMTGHRLLKSLCALGFGMAFYYLVHRFTCGYCSFESVHQRRLDILRWWLTRGIVFFVLIVIINSALH